MLHETLAAQLRAAYDGSPIPPIRDQLANISAAYDVQEINTRRWTDAGRRICGRKIGLTSPAVQKQLGVDEPDYGMLFADMSVLDGECVDLGRLLQPKIEAEVAFVLARDLARPDLIISDVISAIEYCLPAIEIVDSRIAGWNIRLSDTVADNASSALFVLGTQPRLLKDVNLRDARMELLRGTERASDGIGSACLGNPLHATLWLARKMIEVGRPLHAGDVILAGALGPMVEPRDGEQFTATIEGLGSVRLAFSRAQ
jgi:2-keto-4-pentenoate hydratase